MTYNLKNIRFMSESAYEALADKDLEVLHLVEFNSSGDGVINKNDGETVYFWSGTQEEYNSQDIANTHPDWICYITDDYDGGSSVYTKSEIDGLLNERLNTSQITNCITKIPQDIKLELNDGTLTLKAGSKVYAPNGFEEDGTTPKFDEVTIASDISAEIIGPNNQELMICVQNSAIVTRTLSQCVSGDGVTAVNGFAYNTTTNKIGYFNSVGFLQIDECSLPIALCTSNDTGKTKSIDKVFNGFGYIGSTVFALPGIEGLIPNGRNADGSLKNIKSTITKVVTRSDLGNNKNNTIVYNLRGFFNYGNYTYDEKYNYLNSGYGNELKEFIFGFYTTDSTGKITSFTPKQTVNLVYRSDSSWLSGLSMPSDRYIDLTLGASGSSYTAPANGWVVCNIDVSANGYLSVNGVYCQGSNISSYVGCKVPVTRGMTFTINYGNHLNTINFIFQYAEGEE